MAASRVFQLGRIGMNIQTKEPKMDGRQSKWTAFVITVFSLLILIPSLSWKPLVTGAWRLGNPTTVIVANNKLTIPWPWMTTRTGDPTKLRAFATEWPGVNNDYATALISITSSDDARMSDHEWFSRSKDRYESHGFRDVKQESFGTDSVLCAEAISDKTESCYCRSKQGYDITLVGPHKLLGSLVKSLSADR